MNSCSFCGNKTLKNVKTDYTYKLDDKYLFVKNVPSVQCEYCGEKYFEAKVLKKIEKDFFDIYDGKKKAIKEIVVPTEDFEMVKR